MFSYAIFWVTTDAFRVEFTAELSQAQRARLSIGDHVEQLAPQGLGFTVDEAAAWLRSQKQTHGSIERFLEHRTIQDDPHEQTNLPEYIGHNPQPSKRTS